MTVKYIHARRDDYGFTMGGTPLSGRTGGFTVAYEYTPIDEDLVDVNFAVAQCSKQDSYCKARGREIALGRLKKDKSYGFRKKYDHSDSFYAWLAREVFFAAEDALEEKKKALNASSAENYLGCMGDFSDDDVRLAHIAEEE